VQDKQETAWNLPARFYLAKYYEKQGNIKSAAESYKQVQPGIFLSWWMVSFLNDSWCLFNKNSRLSERRFGLFAESRELWRL
jgi:lipoprotein NlpI